MKLDAKKVTRSVYTYWNATSEIGGLYGVLISLSCTILSVLSFQMSVNHLADQLYIEVDSNVPDATMPQSKMVMKSSKLRAIREWM